MVEHDNSNFPSVFLRFVDGKKFLSVPWNTRIHIYENLQQCSRVQIWIKKCVQLLKRRAKKNGKIPNENDGRFAFNEL